MYYFVLKSKSGTPHGFLDYEWQYSTRVDDAMVFDTIKELEEWMDESWEEEEEDHIHGDNWRNLFSIQKVYCGTIP